MRAAEARWHYSDGLVLNVMLPSLTKEEKVSIVAGYLGVSL